jgi:hypothetical protein
MGKQCYILAREKIQEPILDILISDSQFPDAVPENVGMGAP